MTELRNEMRPFHWSLKYFNNLCCNYSSPAGGDDCRGEVREGVFKYLLCKHFSPREHLAVCAQHSKIYLGPLHRTPYWGFICEYLIMWQLILLDKQYHCHVKTGQSKHKTQDQKCQNYYIVFHLPRKGSGKVGSSLDRKSFIWS